MRTLVITILVFLVACTEKRNENRQQDQLPSDEVTQQNSVLFDDTVFSVTYRGRVFSKQTKVYDARRLSDLQAFINTWETKELFFSTLDSADITGDGALESFSTTIRMRDSTTAIIHNMILSNGKAIWEQKYIFDYYLDSLFEQLVPISRFYEAVKYFSTFVREPRSHLSVPAIMLPERDNEFWKSHLESFNGRLIFKIDAEQSDSYIWDPRHHKFILYYAP